MGLKKGDEEHSLKKGKKDLLYYHTEEAEETRKKRK